MMNPPSLESHGPSWSKLPSDLLHSVFKRLGFADFQRAKSVCSFWKSASKQCAPNNIQIPWLIQFPEKGKDCCLLLNPEEKDKTYKIRDLGVKFANSRCLATCGSWLLMRDPRYDFYIFNIFTREMIDLPSVESQVGMIKIERTLDDIFYVKISDEEAVAQREAYIQILCPLLWIDEKTNDYVVMWITEYRNTTVLVHSRNGDQFWKQTKIFIDCLMVYKDHKLYMYNYHRRNVTILDCSGDSPRKISETQVKPKQFLMLGGCVCLEPGDAWDIKKYHLVVTVTGDILKVKSIVRSNSHVWSFRIKKMDSSKSKWEKLTSLGDEAILLDLGITVLANTVRGVNRNSIYFSGHHDHRPYAGEFDRVWSEDDILIFDLDTHMVERPRLSICSSIQTSDARWFVPNSRQS